MEHKTIKQMMSSIAQTIIGDQHILVWIIIGIIGLVITWKGANTVEESTSKISDGLGISQAIQGGIIAAVATSFPELSVVVLSVVFIGSFGVGAGALIGTALFNLLVIPALVTIITGDTHTNKGIVFRDTLFYIVSILAFLAVLCLGVLRTDGTDGVGSAEVTPLMGVGMILIYILYVILLFSKTKDEEKKEKDRSISMGKQAVVMVFSLIIVLVGVEFMLAMTLEISSALGAQPFLISVTVLSILSSLPDLLVGIRMGEDDERKAAISNVFGTNTFNFLIVLPVGAVIAGGVTLTFTSTIPLLIYLFYSTLVVSALVGTDFEITQLVAYMMLSLYLLFVLWMVAESLGITSVLSGGGLDLIISDG